MIFRATYSNRAGAGVQEVTFEADDLTDALKIVCQTQVTPDEAVEIIIEPLDRTAP